jgi:hypothetical protein
MSDQLAYDVQRNGDVCGRGDVVEDERAFESAQQRAKGGKQFVKGIGNGRARNDSVTTGVKVAIGDRDVFQIAEAHIDFRAPFHASDCAFDEPVAERLRHRDPLACSAEDEDVKNAKKPAKNAIKAFQGILGLQMERG